MAITFPSSPSPGDIFTSNGKSWQYVNGKWESYGETVAPDVFAVDAANDVVYVYGSLSAGASASVGTNLEVSGDITSTGLTIDTDTLYVDSTNDRVGIGTTSPEGSLHIEKDLGTAANDTEILQRFKSDVGGGNDSYLTISNIRESSGGSTWNSAHHRIQHRVDSTDMAYVDFNPESAERGLSLGTDNVERVTIDSSGNVGIGTTSPTSPLHISSTASDAIVVQREGVDQTSSLISYYDADERLGYVGYAGNDDLRLKNQAVNGRIYLGIYTNDAAVSIDESGKVGINRASPTGKLHIYSNTSGNGQDANYLKMDRPNTSFESAINWATAGTNKWFLGHDNTGNDDFYLYSWGGSTYAMQVAPAGYVTMEKQPAFTARITTTGTLYNAQVLPFSSASLNVGNHYSTSTYLFTAPVSGHYFFSYSVLIRNNSGTARTETGFWKNGGWLMNRGNSYVNSTGSVSDHNQASSSVITYMAANDTMGIYQLQTAPSDTYGGTALSVFTGRLVS